MVSVGLVLVAGCARDDPNRVAPDGAPFSFQLPTSFTQQPALADRTKAGAAATTHAAAVAIDVYNTITVLSFPLDQDASTLSDGELVRQLAPVVRTLTTTQRRVSAVQRRDVKAGRAMYLRILDNGTSQASDLYFIFAGRSEVEVACQWQDKPKAVANGCQAVLDSLRVG